MKAEEEMATEAIGLPCHGHGNEKVVQKVDHILSPAISDISISKKLSSRAQKTAVI